MGEAIEEGGGELLVAGEDVDPFCKREIGRRDRGAALIAVGDQIEEQLAAGAVEWHKAELVHDEDVRAEQPLLQAYVVWIGIVLAMYPLCRWFAAVKARRGDWRQGYL